LYIWLPGTNRYDVCFGNRNILKKKFCEITMIYIPGTNRLYTALLRLIMRFDFLGKGVRIDPASDIRMGAAPYIHIGNGVQIAQGAWLNIPFEAGPPCKGKPVIRIGDGTGIGRRCTISGINQIDIGPNVLFGPNVFITDHSHEFRDLQLPIIQQGVTEPGSIVIEEGCWLGYNSVILAHKNRKLCIGRNSVIGANAVVTKSFPPYSVLVGNPARNVSKAK
jgi:acetyltransferase-like isoleucine patch superfamily enzyme